MLFDVDGSCATCLDHTIIPQLFRKGNLEIVFTPVPNRVEGKQAVLYNTKTKIQRTAKVLYNLPPSIKKRPLNQRNLPDGKVIIGQDWSTIEGTDEDKEVDMWQEFFDCQRDALCAQIGLDPKEYDARYKSHSGPNAYTVWFKAPRGDANATFDLEHYLRGPGEPSFHIMSVVVVHADPSKHQLENYIQFKLQLGKRMYDRLKVKQSFQRKVPSTDPAIVAKVAALNAQDTAEMDAFLTEVKAIPSKKTKREPVEPRTSKRGKALAIEDVADVESLLYNDVGDLL